MAIPVVEHVTVELNGLRLASIYYELASLGNKNVSDIFRLILPGWEPRDYFVIQVIFWGIDSRDANSQQMLWLAVFTEKDFGVPNKNTLEIIIRTISSFRIRKELLTTIPYILNGELLQKRIEIEDAVFALL